MPLSDSQSYLFEDSSDSLDDPITEYSNQIDESIIAWIRDDDLTRIATNLTKVQSQYDDLLQERRSISTPFTPYIIRRIIDIDDHMFDLAEDIQTYSREYADQLNVVLTEKRPDRYASVVEMNDILTQANILLLSVSNLDDRVESMVDDDLKRLNRLINKWTLTLYQEYWKLGVFDVDLTRDSIGIEPLPISDIELVYPLLERVDTLISQIEKQWQREMDNNPTPGREPDETIITIY